MAIRLILPAIIRSSQRLSHACVSLTSFKWKTADGSLYQLESYGECFNRRITVVILEQILAKKRDFKKRCIYLIKPTFVVIHDILADCSASAAVIPSTFCPISWIVG